MESKIFEHHLCIVRKKISLGKNNQSKAHEQEDQKKKKKKKRG